MFRFVVLTQYCNVTDRQTDRHTDGRTSFDSIVRARRMHVYHADKSVINQVIAYRVSTSGYN